VNVAARFEQLAEPGGVVVSGTAFDHLQGKLDLPLEFAGEQRVKNIERLVRAYRVRLDGTAIRFSLRRARQLGRWAVAVALALLLLGAAAAGW
jgi:class 3 adenylate cyclase